MRHDDPEDDPPAREASDWAPPSDCDGDGSVAAMAALSTARPAPKRNSRWRNTKTGQIARVMSAAPVEGYVVARYKGAMPWLLHVNDWHAKFVEEAC